MKWCPCNVIRVEHSTSQRLLYLQKVYYQRFVGFDNMLNEKLADKSRTRN
jgi:hypothetical protein